MTEIKCPYIEECPFFNNLHLTSTGNVLKNLYCLSGFKNCRRYQLKAAGKPVPPELWPNGKIGY